jgi:hypothetical protein
MKTLIAISLVSLSLGCAAKKVQRVEIPDFSVVVPGRCIEKITPTADAYCRYHGNEATCYRLTPKLKEGCE